MYATDFLENLRRITKLHESVLKDICQEYQLSLTEATIVSFLHNNPGRDTAADIVELKRLQKGNVSQAVETLYQKGLLARKQDAEDRRRIHLSLTAQAEPVVQSIKALWGAFEEEIFAGLPEEEFRTFVRVNEKIRNNIQLAVKRREQK